MSTSDTPIVQPRRRYIREGLLPTVFCAGCGGGTVLNCFTRAIESVGLDPDQLCSVTGIGCSSWVLSPYFSADTLHTTHGRAIAFGDRCRIAYGKVHGGAAVGGHGNLERDFPVDLFPVRSNRAARRA